MSILFFTNPLASGKISNDEYEEALARLLNAERDRKGEEDRAVEAIGAGMWLYYSDQYQHKLKSQAPMARASREEFGRWILFLQSDRLYEWPFTRPVLGPLDVILSLLTCGFWRRWISVRYSKAGDLSLWPYTREEDLEEDRVRYGGGGDGPQQL